MADEIKDKSKKIPPKWWTNIISDLERASLAAQKSYDKPGVIIGKDTDKYNSDITIGYYIRLDSDKVGYYPVKNSDKTFPVGAKLKGELPKPTDIIDEPPIESYIYSVIKERINLIPSMWLRKIIGKIVAGKPITPKEDLRPFHSWILIPVDKRSKALIDLLYRAVEYEGLKGLYRFNDILE